ncbi:hypothetical protein PIB30_034196 [Stylosanthes scabra]|uniref:Uncharacterized protein n=1 Tax=Stylosanthes scabra TaxID=79078 RepID=A0ABU6RD87_9FABA|nr:hypothetical protein [Stylosanthes scabra]
MRSLIVTIRKKNLRKGNWQTDGGVRLKPGIIKGRCCLLTRSLTKRKVKKNSQLNAKTQAHAWSPAGLRDLRFQYCVSSWNRLRCNGEDRNARNSYRFPCHQATTERKGTPPRKTTETFQITPPSKKKNRLDDGRMRGKEAAQIGMIEALIKELLQKLREEDGLEKKEK